MTLDNLDSCTLAILLRSEVHPADLPGQEGHSDVVSDVASYHDITEAADMVYALCGKDLRAPGWAVVGKPTIPATDSDVLC